MSANKIIETDLWFDNLKKDGSKMNGLERNDGMKYCDECGCEIRVPQDIGKEFTVSERVPDFKRTRRVKHYLCEGCYEEK